jgi:hypothetical protein
MATKTWSVIMVITDEYSDGSEEMNAEAIANEIRSNWDMSAGLEIKEIKVGLISQSN